MNPLEIPDVGALVAELGKSNLFKSCALDDLAEVVRASQRQRFEHGEDIVQEGGAARHVFWIQKGEVSVLKASAGAGAQHEIARLREGQHFGEMALMDPGERSATVRAAGPVEVVAVPISALVRLSETRPAFSRVFIALAREVVTRLRSANATTVGSLDRALEQERTRVTMGRFMLSLITAYSLYTFLLGTATQLKQAFGRSEMVSVPVIAATALILVSFMRRSGYPPSFFGLTAAGGWRHAAEALLLTTPLMAATLVTKLYLLASVPAMHGQPVFQLLAPPAAGQSASFSPGLLLAYVVFIPFQELIYRGGLQGALEHFLAGRPGKTWQAILASNIIFSAGHLYISPGFAAIAFVSGLFWGWLYSRQRSLVGVSLSHVVLGIWALDVVDLGVLE